MSTQTVQICDIEGCNIVANSNIDPFVFTVTDDQGTRIETEYQVDLCPSHEHEYRSKLPRVKISGYNKHLEEDIQS